MGTSIIQAAMRTQIITSEGNCPTSHIVQEKNVHGWWVHIFSTSNGGTCISKDFPQFPS